MKKIAIAFQDPSAHLDPLFTVKSHFKEIYQYHLRGKISIVDWFNQNTEILGKLGLDNPEIVMSQYPFQLSGGQSQLILLALSLSCHPRLIIADEISSSLDIGQQVNLVEFLLSHLKEIESTMILISHDLRLVSHFTNYVMVMFQGLDIEYGKTEELIMKPLHPYTASLVKVAGYLSLGNENISTTEPLTTPTPLYSGNGGCLYYHRCEKRNKHCLKNSPPRIHINSKRWVRCFLYE
jgi:peptide/nickel transport system ATP-binding protein